MKLVSMKRTKEKEKNSKYPSLVSESNEDLYPYGLQITLNTECIKKLGIDLKNFAAGDKVNITAIGEITTIRDVERKREDDLSLEIQIQQLGFDVNPTSAAFSKKRSAGIAKPR